MRSKKRFRQALSIVLIFGCIGAGFFYTGSPVWGITRVDALPAWQGNVREQLVDFIFDVSTPGNPDFIPRNDRVAVFDMDGTLMSEKPTYFVFDVAIHYLTGHCDEISKKGPDYSALCHAAKNHDYRYLKKHVEDTLALPFEGKTYTFYRDYCRQMFETAVNSIKKRPLKEMIYSPMIQLIDLLHQRDFTVYVVSGSLQFCIMAISEKYLHVDESRCIGSMVVATAAKKGGKTVFRRGNISPPPNVEEGKAIRIMMRTGRAPVLSIGNSGGDVCMLEFTANSPYRTFSGLIDHDDPREFVYRKEKLLKLAKKKKWTVISMKESFKGY